jgi:hypothetical protein
MQTLPRHQAPDQVRRARDVRRAGLAILVLVIALGLSSVLGARSATTASTARGYTLAVTHAVVTRPGLATPFRIDVGHAGGFADPVTIAVSRQMFERFDFQNFYPNPSTETGSDDYLYYEFDPPPGDRLRVSLDARTSPDQNGSAERYQVALVVAGQPVTEVSFRLVVMP